MKKSRRGLALLLFASVLSWSATEAAQPPPPPETAEAEAAALHERVARGATLPDLLGLAYRANPTIRAARAGWRGVVERHRVDTAWPDPELMAEGMYPKETLGETASPMDWTVGLSQRVPLWGRQDTAGEVNLAEAKIAKLKLDAAVRDVVLQVRRSAAELRYLDEAGGIARAQQELLAQLTGAGAAAYAAERASLYDVMKARAQSGQLDYDAQRIAEQRWAERARLNALLDRAADAPVGTPAAEPPRPLLYTVEEIDALAEANTEDLQVARAEVERAEAMARLTRYETLPEFTVGLTYGRAEEVYQVGVLASMMLPLRPGKNAGRIAAAGTDVERMRALYGARLNEIRTELRDVVFRLRNAERLVTLYRDDLVPQAQRAVETSQAGLAQGGGGLGDAAEAQSAWYAFRLALARAEADRTGLLARLESLAGRPLTVRDGDPAPLPEGRR